MKLSVALMLPSDIKFNPRHYLSEGEGCLLGQAMNVATGRLDCGCHEIMEQWPWLRQSFKAPWEVAESSPSMNALPAAGIASGERIVTRYAFMVEHGLLTREQCAEWVASVEPPEDNERESHTSELLTGVEIVY